MYRMGWEGMYIYRYVAMYVSIQCVVRVMKD